MDGSDKTDDSQGEFKDHALLSVLDSIDRGLGWVERTMIAGSVLLMALLMSAHVVGNLLFDRGIPGTYEITDRKSVV